MKVTLDLSKLLEEGKLSPAEAQRLYDLGAHDTGAFAINILVSFGVVAVTTGAVALVPTPVTALIIGLAVLATGLALTLLPGKEQWSLLAQICLVLGALMFSGGVLAIGSRDRRTIEFTHGRGGARARRLSRRSRRLLGRDLYARHL
jgi:hypothetical protein